MQGEEYSPGRAPTEKGSFVATATIADLRARLSPRRPLPSRRDVGGRQRAPATCPFRWRGLSRPLRPGRRERSIRRRLSGGGSPAGTARRSCAGPPATIRSIVLVRLSTARPDHAVEIGAGTNKMMAPGVHPGAIGAHWAGGLLALLVLLVLLLAGQPGLLMAGRTLTV